MDEPIPILTKKDFTPEQNLAYVKRQLAEIAKQAFSASPQPPTPPPATSKPPVP